MKCKRTKTLALFHWSNIFYKDNVGNDWYLWKCFDHNKILCQPCRKTFVKKGYHTAANPKYPTTYFCNHCSLKPDMCICSPKVLFDEV